MVIHCTKVNDCTAPWRKSESYITKVTIGSHVARISVASDEIQILRLTDRTNSE
jgi:hypothetical protein